MRSWLTALLFIPLTALATVRVSPTNSLSDVQATVNASVDGDTVQIPTGTVSWTGFLTVLTAITLEGQGTITFDSTPSNQGGPRATACGTSITCNGPAEVMKITLVANKVTTLHGIQFAGGSSQVLGLVYVLGANTDPPPGRRLHMYNCVWNNAGTFPAIPFLLNTVLGVIDHSSITTAPGTKWLEIWDEFWNGHEHGDGAWADDDNFGTDRFFFVENNNITSSGSCDGEKGERLVIRWNTINGAAITNHGSEAAGTRGCRAMEIYNNTAVTGTGQSFTFSRGGAWLIHDNFLSGYGPYLNLVNYNSWQGSNTPFQGTDGVSPWHQNDPGNPFVTGTITAVQAPVGNIYSAQDNTKTWGPGTDTFGQYSGWQVRKLGGGPSAIPIASMTQSAGVISVTTSTPHGFTNADAVSIWGANQYHYNNLWDRFMNVTSPTTFTVDSVQTANAAVSPATGAAMFCSKTGSYGLIINNTSTTTVTNGTFTWPDGINGAKYGLRFQVGDHYEINRITQAMDQCGAGKGALVGLTDAAPPVGWQTTVGIKEGISPNYQWNNNAGTTHPMFDNRNGGNGFHYDCLRPNIHYFDNTQKGGGYTPYTYPHPLNSGSVATNNVAVSASPLAGGTVTGGGTYATGSTQTVTATANSGYAFVNWTEGVNTVSTSASYSFLLNADRILVANFSSVGAFNTITVLAQPANGGTVAGGGTFTQGTVKTVTATPNSGWTFVNWTENGTQVSTNASYQFTLSTNRNLVGNFLQNATPTRGGRPFHQGRLRKRKNN